MEHQTITTIRSGGVFIRNHVFRFWVEINGQQWNDITDFNSPVQCKMAMRAEVERLRLLHKVR